VDISACEWLHGAVVQTLLALGPRLQGTPASPFLRDLLRPALLRSTLADERQNAQPKLL
jgi:hypothetical protein